MEYGVGIHGEPGIRRERVIPAQELATRLVDTLCKAQNLKNGTLDARRHSLPHPGGQFHDQHRYGRSVGVPAEAGGGR